ncbi:hypothetical protein D3C76_1548420 [compost metagenome]
MRLGKGVQCGEARAHQQQALRGEALKQGCQGLLWGALGETVGHCQSSFKSPKTSGPQRAGKEACDRVVAYCWQGSNVQSLLPEIGLMPIPLGEAMK